eukprot:scaffold9489_cov24-Tisochrysis_lutea.AAC.3
MHASNALYWGFHCENKSAGLGQIWQASLRCTALTPPHPFPYQLRVTRMLMKAWHHVPSAHASCSWHGELGTRGV